MVTYKRILVVFVITLVVVVTAEWLWLKSRSDLATLAAGDPAQGELVLAASRFTMVDQAGQTVSDQSFRGKFQLVVFGYTRCPDICPTVLSTVARTLDLLELDADQVQPLFVTLDPERDTPEILGDYVGAVDSRILALSGSLEATKAIARSYRVYFAKAGDGEDYALDHTTYLYLVDPDGATAAYFPYDQTPQDLAERVRQAIRERS